MQKDKQETEGKSKEIKLIFERSYLGAILLKFGMWRTEGGGKLHIKIVLFHKGSTGLCMHENCIIALPMSNTLVQCASFLSHMTYYAFVLLQNGIA